MGIEEWGGGGVKHCSSFLWFLLHIIFAVVKSCPSIDVNFMYTVL